MKNYEKITASLLDAYKSIFADKRNEPNWAVHKRNTPSELVLPTIPFVGKQYAEQNVKILVYASAENLSGYWKGNDDDWPGDWLDDDAFAINRHRNCFDNEEMQQSRKQSGKLPYVHCGPMEDGGLLTAVMYLASKLRNGYVDEPYKFYESIAFGNYGKFSIETELQAAIRNNPALAEDKARLKKIKKELNRCNKDYATMSEYLKISSAYIQADIEILKPDYIIMPNVKDNGFIASVKGNAKTIRIYQMISRVVNNYIAPSKRNHYCSKYSKRDVNELPTAVKFAYESIRGINLENYRYVFDYLDQTLALELSKGNDKK